MSQVSREEEPEDFAEAHSRYRRGAARPEAVSEPHVHTPSTGFPPHTLITLRASLKRTLRYGGGASVQARLYGRQHGVVYVVSMIDWVKKTSAKAIFVTSHCDGSFVLAKSGVLDGFQSTTFPGDIHLYKEMFPHLQIHENVVFVRDGKFITSAGGAKSFEASLFLCELLYGKEIAKSLAKGLVIDWNLENVPHLIVAQ